jgi:hypothetical protein
MKGDTLEYKADSFVVRPNANVEELLRRLPGIQVDRNGNITAQNISGNMPDNFKDMIPKYNTSYFDYLFAGNEALYKAGRRAFRVCPG